MRRGEPHRIPYFLDTGPMIQRPVWPLHQPGQVVDVLFILLLDMLLLFFLAVVGAAVDMLVVKAL